MNGAGHTCALQKGGNGGLEPSLIFEMIKVREGRDERRGEERGRGEEMRRRRATSRREEKRKELRLWRDRKALTKALSPSPSAFFSSDHSHPSPSFRLLKRLVLSSFNESIRH